MTAVISSPDVECFEITPDLDFIVLACDGIWDLKSSQEAVDFIHGLHERIENGEVIEEIPEPVPDSGILIPADPSQSAKEKTEKFVSKGLAKVIEHLFEECCSENLEEN